ncbi:MAG: hypothetical protein ACI90V_011815 [Bacillariaceae sp.]|jgi:hypothetical protein
MFADAIMIESFYGTDVFIVFFQSRFIPAYLRAIIGSVRIFFRLSIIVDCRDYDGMINDQ